jgi:glycosyltransferase involved in cell wall biosynthesis
MEVIIATYNRPNSVARLVKELQHCHPAPNRIIVVDSSDEPNPALAGVAGVTYLRARHKNQPYQRYVGALAARSPTVVFLDDDLWVEEPRFIEFVARGFLEATHVGVGINFHHESAVKPVFRGPRNRLAGIILRAWEAVHKGPLVGEVTAAGRQGEMPKQDGVVRFFRGGAMAFRTDVALKLFDPVLFALNERRLGMGEDKAISIRANRFGKLWWVAMPCFRHPADQGSHYKEDPASFLTKVLVSRLHLAMVYYETFGGRRSLAYKSFAWELLRVAGSGLLRVTEEPRLARRGIMAALRMVLATRLDPDRLTPGIDYWSDAKADAQMPP